MFLKFHCFLFYVCLILGVFAPEVGLLVGLRARLKAGFAGHLFWSAGETNIGAFVGAGNMTDNQDEDEGDAYWYGIEASRDFGNIQVAGQLGLATHRNDHSSLDYTDYPMGGVEVRYFTGTDMMLRGALETAKGNVHDDSLSVTRLSVDATIGLGGISGLYGAVGGRILDADGGNNQGHTT